MTLKLFKKMIDTNSNNPEELLSLLENAWDDRAVDMLQYVHIRSDIKMQYYHDLAQIKEQAIQNMKIDILENFKERDTLTEQILKNIKRG